MKMQLTSFLVITTTALLVMGDAASPFRSRAPWLFIDRSGSKEEQFALRSQHPTREETDDTRKHQERVIAFENDVKINNIKRKGITINGNNEDEKYIDKEIKHSSEGVTKKNWHNYPRRLDKLQRFKRDYGSNEIINSDESRQVNEIPVSSVDMDSSSDLDLQPVRLNEELDGDSDSLTDLENYLVGDLNPILILKIRLSLMRNLKARNEAHLLKNKRTIGLDKFDTNIDTMEMGELSNMSEVVPEYPVIEPSDSFPSWKVDPEIKTIYITRGRLPTSHSPHHYPLDLSDRHRRGHKRKRSDSDIPVSKRIFSFWTRMQGIHSGKDIEHRRHFHSYAGFPSFDINGDIVSAETRAALVRPPGSPLRWG